MTEALKSRYQLLTEQINHLLTPKVFKVDLTEYNRESLIEQLKQKQQELLAIIQTLEGGVDTSKFQLRPEHLIELERKYPHFDAKKLTVHEDGNLELTFNNTPIDIEYTSRASLIGNDGVIYSSTPVFTFKLETVGTTLDVYNKTEGVSDGNLINFLTTKSDSQQWVNLQALKTFTHCWAKDTLTELFKKTEELTSDTSSNQTISLQSKVTTNTYSHAHSNEYSSKLGRLCTGSSNKFVKIIQQGQLTDIFKLIQFLDGASYWTQAANLSDCYGTLTAPRRSRSASSAKSPIEITEFVAKNLVTHTTMLRSIYSSEEHKELYKYIMVGTKVLLESSIGGSSFSYEDESNLSKFATDPNPQKLTQYVNKITKEVDALFSNKALEQLPPALLVNGMLYTMEGANSVIIFNHTLALMNNLTMANAKVAQNGRTMFIKNPSIPGILRNYLSALTVLEYCRSLYTAWLHYETLPQIGDYLGRSDMILNIVNEDINRFAQNNIPIADTLGSSISFIRTFLNFLPTFQKRLNTNKALVNYLRNTGTTFNQLTRTPEFKLYLEALDC